MQSGEPQGIGDLLSGVIGPKVLRHQRKVDAVRLAWARLVGEEIASQTRITSLRRGTLMIEVRSAALCHRLASFQRDQLLLGIKEKVPQAEVLHLHFRIGTVT